MSDYDSPWKEALDMDFRAFLEFFFPRVPAWIDWNRGFEPYDKELQQLVPEAEVKRRYADKLFKVWLRDGREAWVLIHVEIQAQQDPEFPERMFVYNYRLHERYRRPVVSLAILGDDQHEWRPDKFEYGFGGSTMGLAYPMVKLLDYAGLLDWLDAHPNPFAPLVVAHLKTMATCKDAGARREWKFCVIRSLYQRGYTPDRIRQLFRLIDWMMDLPEELEQQLKHDLAQFEQEKHMPYITSVERLARKEGIAEGKAESLLQVLKQRFPSQIPPDFETKIRGTQDPAQLEQWLDLAVQAGSLEEFREGCQ